MNKEIVMLPIHKRLKKAYKTFCAERDIDMMDNTEILISEFIKRPDLMEGTTVFQRLSDKEKKSFITDILRGV
jgi:hypothetical protein